MRVIYLAGAEVFDPDAEAIAGMMKHTLHGKGMKGAFPSDTRLPPGYTGRSAGIWIRDSNMRTIRSSAGVIASMKRFRGPSMDVGTAYEMGVAAALEIPVVGWISGERGDYASRISHSVNADGQRIDEDGMFVEDFGLEDNLMMACGVHSIENSFEAAACVMRELLEVLDAHT